MSSNLVKSKVHFNFNGTQVHKKRQELNFLSVFCFIENLRCKILMLNQIINTKSNSLIKIQNINFCLGISTFHISKHLWNKRIPLDSIA